MKVADLPLALLVVCLMIFLLLQGFQETDRSFGLVRRSPLTLHPAHFINSLPPLTFYSYSTSNFSLPHDKHNPIPMPTELAHTNAFEKLLYASLMRSHYTILSPERADLFYIPIYITSEPSPKFRRQVIPFIRQQGPWHDRYLGVDHIAVHMVFSINLFSISFHEQRKIPYSLTYPDILWDWVCNFPRWNIRNTIVPYNSNLDPTLQLPKNLSVFFMGDMRPMFWSSHGPRVRKRMVPYLENITNSLVIRTKRWDRSRTFRVYDFPSLLRRSEFCVVPYGDSPSSKRLYDALRTRCVPIVLSDEIRFPFEVEFVKYENIALQIPMYSPELIEHVMMLANDRWREIIRANMRDVFEILNLNVNAEIVIGQQTWAWLWSEFFKACYVASAKRRHRVVNRYLAKSTVGIGVEYAKRTV
jgi:hypothetical protein